MRKYDLRRAVGFSGKVCGQMRSSLRCVGGGRHKVGSGKGRKIIPLSLLALALSGCATTRYVTVPCITKDQVLPSEPDKIHDKLTGEADKDLRTVAGSNIRLRSWGEGLLGIVEGCRG